MEVWKIRAFPSFISYYHWILWATTGIVWHWLTSLLKILSLDRLFLILVSLQSVFTWLIIEFRVLRAQLHCCWSTENDALFYSFELLTLTLNFVLIFKDNSSILYYRQITTQKRNVNTISGNSPEAVLLVQHETLTTWSQLGNFPGFTRKRLNIPHLEACVMWISETETCSNMWYTGNL